MVECEGPACRDGEAQETGRNMSRGGVKTRMRTRRTTGGPLQGTASGRGQRSAVIGEELGGTRFYCCKGRAQPMRDEVCLSRACCTKWSMAFEFGPAQDAVRSSCFCHCDWVSCPASIPSLSHLQACCVVDCCTHSHRPDSITSQVEPGKDPIPVQLHTVC